MRARKSERRHTGRAVRTAFAVAMAFLVAWGSPIVSRAEATGVVLPKSLNIRKTPDQGSEVVGSATAGKEISIRGKVDVGETTWYQVYINADTWGYVRADMIKKTGEGSIPEVSADSASGGSQSAAAGEGAQDGDSQTEAPADSGSVQAAGAQEQAQEAMERQYASTKNQTRVRPDPSTGKDPVDSLTPGSQVVVSGKSQGGDGKTWYFITFTGTDGAEKTGFVRSDLVELGELLPAEEAAQPEEPAEAPAEPEEPVRNDYEVKFETGADGQEAWYLYDNVKGQKEKLAPLLESVASQGEEDQKTADALVRQRVVIVALAALAALLALAVIVLAFKLRGAYEDDEDEDDEEEKPGRREKAREAKGSSAGEERPVRRRASAEEERPARRGSSEEERSARRRSSEEERSARRRASGEDRPARRSAPAGEEERPRRRGEEQERPSRRREAQREAAAPKRKAKNFLLDDDEFEFEFLNMDDKDMK